MATSNDPTKTYWAEKERETGQKLLIASAGTYIRGAPGLDGPIVGIFYLMSGGAHFESFSRHHPLAGLFARGSQGEPPKKVSLKFSWAHVDKLTDLNGETNSRAYPFFRRLLIRLHVEPNGVVIHPAGEDAPVLFDCTKSAYGIIGAYQRLSA